MEWVARNKLNIPYIIHILDDFLIAAESPNKLRTSLQNFLHFCEDLGIPMAPEKKRGPCPCIAVCRHRIGLWQEKVFNMFNRNLPLRNGWWQSELDCGMEKVVKC